MRWVSIANRRSHGIYHSKLLFAILTLTPKQPNHRKHFTGQGKINLLKSLGKAKGCNSKSVASLEF